MSKNKRGGVALRGSSEFRAWLDFGLYVRREVDGLVLDLEFKAAPSVNGVNLKLYSENGTITLGVVDDFSTDPLSSEWEPELPPHQVILPPTAKEEDEVTQILQLLNPISPTPTCQLLNQSGISALGLSRTLHRLRYSGAIKFTGKEEYVKIAA